MPQGPSDKETSFQASWFPIQTDDLPAPLQPAGQIYAEVIDYERTIYTPSIYSQPQYGVARTTPSPLSPIRDYVEESQGSFAHDARYDTAFPLPVFGNQGSPIDTSGYIDVLQRKKNAGSRAQRPRFTRHIFTLALCLAIELILIVALPLSFTRWDAQFGIVPYDGIGTNAYKAFRFLPTAMSIVLALAVETAYLLFYKTKAVHPLARPRKGLQASWLCIVTFALVVAVQALSSILFQPFVDISKAPIHWLWAIKPQVAVAMLSLLTILFALNMWMLYRMVSFRKMSYELCVQEDTSSTGQVARVNFFRFGPKLSAIEVMPFVAFFVMFHFTTPDFQTSLTIESPNSISIRPADAIYTVFPLLLALWIPVSRAPISTALFPEARLRPYQKLLLLVNTVSAWAIPVLAGGLFSVQFSSLQQQVVVRPDMEAFCLLLTLVACHFVFALVYHGQSLIKNSRPFGSKETAILCFYDSKHDT